jgi:hypothetical protein
MSIHPTMTNEEMNYVCDSIIALAENFKAWERDYQYQSESNEYVHNKNGNEIDDLVNTWFKE